MISALRAAAMLRRELDADVLLLLVALGLIAVGFWNWWRPGAFLVPGGALLWICLPSRTRFIVSEPDVKIPRSAPRLSRTAAPVRPPSTVPAYR
jgi:hypothetical protein